MQATKEVYRKTYSIGGGFIVDEENFGKSTLNSKPVSYPYASAEELLKHCKETGLSISSLMMKNELDLHTQAKLMLISLMFIKQCKVY